MDVVLQDVRYGLRTLWRSPAFTLFAVLTLGLGIGANASIVSVLNATLLRPPAVSDPDSLVWITRFGKEERRGMHLSHPDLLDLRSSARSFDGLAAYAPVDLALTHEELPRKVRGQIVTGNYFDLLGLHPAAGRGFLAEEDLSPGVRPVAVIAHGLWQRLFAASPGAIGSRLRLNGHEFTIVGVAPEGFSGLEISDEAEIWVPMMMAAAAMPGPRDVLNERGHTIFSVVGRLLPGVSRDAAVAEVASIAAALEMEHPVHWARTGLAAQALAGGIRPGTQGETVAIGTFLMGVTGMVLLIAGANIANLLLGRAASRRQEIAVRLALGAGRARLVRQLLTESALLALMGGAAGMLMAAWGIDAALALFGASPALRSAIVLDGTVMLYALGISTVTGLLFGLAPALEITRGDLVPSLKSRSGVASAARRPRLQRISVAVQVAMSLLLLAGAGLLLRSVVKAAAVEPGFATSDRLALSFDLGLLGYDRERTRTAHLGLLEQVRAIPGVESATLAASVPLAGRMEGQGIVPEGGDDSWIMVHSNRVFSDYFRTMEIPLLRGRDIAPADDVRAPLVAVVNETMARRLWPDRDPVGRRFSLQGPEGPWHEVIGVARDARYDDLTEDPSPFMYLPLHQAEGGWSETTLVVSAALEPAAIASSLDRAVRGLDPDLPVGTVTTLEQIAMRDLEERRGVSGIVAAFGLLALLLAAIGLYGVMATAAARRTREIGLRMALGAGRADVLRLFVGEGVRVALTGVIAGVALSLGLMPLMRSMLFGISPTDVLTLAGVSLILIVVAAAASWLPARRASRIDPMTALRNE